MKRVLLFIFITTLLLSSCSDSKYAKIRIETKEEGPREFVLNKLLLNRMVTIDTIKTNSKGVASYRLSTTINSPDFYYLQYNGRNIASMVLGKGDNVVIKTDTLGNYTIENSPESELYKIQNDIFAKSVASFDSLSFLYTKAVDKGDDMRSQELSRELGRMFVNQKREAISFLYNNPKSFTTLAVVFRKINPELPIFSETSDFVIFRRVYDSIQPVFTDSPYVKALADEISSRESTMEMINKISSAEVINYPNIVLPDINAKLRMLSELDGKVILLSFWTYTDMNQRVFNSELKELYNKYNKRGFEIYQVSVDMDKPSWAKSVKEQDLPWISVCDGKGVSSSEINIYKIEKTPTIFLIDKKGDIVKKDIFDDAELEREIRKLL